MCKLANPKITIRKGDIVRLKANDGCLIGDYYIVTDVSDQRVSNLRKIDGGRVQDDKVYIIDKNKIGVVPVVYIMVKREIITDVLRTQPMCLRLDLNFYTERAEKKYKEANLVNPINVAVLYCNDEKERAYIQFTSMMKTGKRVMHNGEEKMIPHLTLFNIITC